MKIRAAPLFGSYPTAGPIGHWPGRRAIIFFCPAVSARLDKSRSAEAKGRKRRGFGALFAFNRRSTAHYSRLLKRRTRSPRRQGFGIYICRIRDAFHGAARSGGLPFSATAGKVPRSGGWGAESRYASMQVCDDGRAIRLARRSSGPHPIRRFAPPSPASWGRGPRGAI
jgi:hypothetical protein